jgi:hypothetical protein
MTQVDERVKEATKAVEESIRRQYEQGSTPVQQAFSRAEADGNPIVGDPNAMAYHELPMEYQTEPPALTMQQLAQWGLSPQEIATFASRGILGPDFMNASMGDLRSAAIGATRQASHQAQIDAGIYAEKTRIDPYWERYWQGQSPHPKTNLMCQYRSWIATLTVPVGINGRIWYFEKGKLYRKVPMEVLMILTAKAAALRDEAILSSIYSMQAAVPLMEKVRMQGDDTNALGWASSMTAGLPERLTPPGM